MASLPVSPCVSGMLSGGAPLERAAVCRIGPSPPVPLSSHKGHLERSEKPQLGRKKHLVCMLIIAVYIISSVSIVSIALWTISCYVNR